MNDQNSDNRDRRPLELRGWNWMHALAEKLANKGTSPNAISVVGIFIGIICAVALYLTRSQTDFERLLWLLSALLMLLRVLSNTLDGMIAVEYGKASKVGLLYNEAPDRMTDVVILIGAGYASGGDIILGYLAACIALFVAYVRTLARTAGAPSDFSGPMNKKGRVLTLLFTAIFMGVAPHTWHVSWGASGQWGVMTIALIIICAGGVITIARRLLSAGKFLRENE